MNVSKYDDQVRSLINGHLHGIGKRLSEYCASAVDGGDVEELSREFTGDIDGYVEEGVREAWEQSEAMRRKMEDEARARKRRTAKDVAVTAALLLALQSFLSRKERVLPHCRVPRMAATPVRCRSGNTPRQEAPGTGHLRRSAGNISKGLQVYRLASLVPLLRPAYLFLGERESNGNA